MDLHSSQGVFHHTRTRVPPHTHSFHRAPPPTHTHFLSAYLMQASTAWRGNYWTRRVRRGEIGLWVEKERGEREEGDRKQKQMCKEQER